MSPWPAPERRDWRPKGGVLRPSELGRALAERPSGTPRRMAVEREVRFPDFDAAVAFVDRLAREAVHYGRRPDVEIVDGNRVRISIANPNHVGLTTAELALMDKVDLAIDQGPAAASGALARRVAA